VIGVEQGGLLKAITNTEALEKKVKKLSAAYANDSVSYGRYNRAINRLAKATNTSKKELLAYGKALRADEKATKKATAETKAFAKARREAGEENKRLNAQRKQDAAATALAAKEEERLKNKFVAGHTAMNIYTKELNELAVARKRGIITTLEQAAAVSRLNAQMKAGTGVFARHSVHMAQSARRTNQLGVMMQQTGYQVGDFAVQVGSGQNVLVAFGQQATQLVGTMAMFAKSTKMIALFSGLGILIPVIAGIGAAFLRTKKAADKTASSLKKVKSRLESVTKSIRDFSLAKEAANAGVSLDELFLTKQTGGVTNVKAKITTLSEEIDKLRDQAKTGFTDIGAIAQSALQEGFKGSAFSNVGEGLEKLSQKQVNQQRLATAANRVPRGQRTEEMKMTQVATQNLSIQNQIAENLRVRKEKTSELMAEEAKLLPLKQLQAKYAEEDLLRTNKGVRATEEKVRLLQTELKHGKDSVELEKLKGEFAVQAFAREVSLLNISQKRKLVLIDQFRLSQDIRKEEEAKLFVANETAKHQDNIAVLTMQLQFGKDSLAVKRLIAQQERKAYEKSLERHNLDPLILKALMGHYDVAKDLADQLERAADAFGKVDLSPTEIKTGVRLGSLPPEALGDIPQSDAEKAAEKVYDTIRKKRRKKTTGGSDTVVNINEIIEARKLQAEQDRVLIGLSGEQHEAQKIYYELLKENEKADVQVTETKLKNSADYIAAKLEENRVLEEATAQQKDLAQSIAGKMGDAFTSIVDGTKSVKDAFKDMARSIIKQLFEVLVVQRLVGSVGVGGKPGSGIAGWLSGTLQADGGAWQGGSQIQAYANGGVVGSPTTFPMAGGKTGLMGEAGPEAIMPLKRGANGKLGVQMEGGGGGNVVIHQNFNFQANGDESVKKLIAQAAPQIANMTKSSMLNDRRRGGATKAVFG
jgi:hypothetical protein